MKKLLSGDRPSDEEIERLAGCLIKVNGTVFGEEELTDMRLAEDEELKQRQLQRLKESQKNPKSK